MLIIQAMGLERKLKAYKVLLPNMKHCTNYGGYLYRANYGGYLYDDDEFKFNDASTQWVICV